MHLYEFQPKQKYKSDAPFYVVANDSNEAKKIVKDGWLSETTYSISTCKRIKDVTFDCDVEVTKKGVYFTRITASFFRELSEDEWRHLSRQFVKCEENRTFGDDYAPGIRKAGDNLWEVRVTFLHGRLDCFSESEAKKVAMELLKESKK